MTRCRVIGVGSPQGDDALGWRVIEQLQQKTLPESVELLCLDRPGPSLLHYLKGVDKVMLVDAADMGLAPGSVRCFPAEQLPQLDSVTCLSSHGWGLHETLQLADSCAISLPSIGLWLIQLARVHPLQPLDGAVEQAVLDVSNSLSGQLSG